MKEYANLSTVEIIKHMCNFYLVSSSVILSLPTVHVIKQQYKFINEVIICNKKIEMGRTCSTYRGEERCIQGFDGETSEKETT